MSTSLTWLVGVCSVPFVTGAVSFDPPEFALSVGSLDDSPLRSAGYVESDLGVCGSAVRRARMAANWRISQLQHMYGTDERADSDKPDARPCLSITVDSQAKAQCCNLITHSILNRRFPKIFSDREVSWRLPIDYFIVIHATRLATTLAQHLAMPTMHGVQLATDEERNEASWIGMTGGLVGACRW